MINIPFPSKNFYIFIFLIFPIFKIYDLSDDFLSEELIQTIFNSILRSSYFSRIFNLDTKNFYYLCFSMLIINSSFHYLKTIYNPFVSESVHFIILSIVIPLIIDYKIRFSFSRFVLLIIHFSCRYMFYVKNKELEIILYFAISTLTLYIVSDKEDISLGEDNRSIFSGSIVADIASYNFWDVSLIVLNYPNHSFLSICLSQFILFYNFLSISEASSNVMRFSDAQIFISCYGYYSNLVNILILKNVSNLSIQVIYQIFFFSVLEIVKFIFKIQFWKEYILDKLKFSSNISENINEERTTECLIHTTSLLTSTLTMCLLYTYKCLSNFNDYSSDYFSYLIISLLCHLITNLAILLLFYISSVDAEHSKYIKNTYELIWRNRFFLLMFYSEVIVFLLAEKKEYLTYSILIKH